MKKLNILTLDDEAHEKVSACHVMKCKNKKNVLIKRWRKAKKSNRQPINNNSSKRNSKRRKISLEINGKCVLKRIDNREKCGKYINRKI